MTTNTRTISAGTVQLWLLYIGKAKDRAIKARATSNSTLLQSMYFDQLHVWLDGLRDELHAATISDVKVEISDDAKAELIEAERES